VAVESDHVRQIYAQGLEEQGAGRLTEAEALFRSILRPDFAEGHLGLGNVFAAQGRLEDAAASYLLALRARPGLDLAAANLRIVWKALGRPDHFIEPVLMLTQHSYFAELFWGALDRDKFVASLGGMLEQIPSSGRYAADNMLVWRRNLSFLDDQPLMMSLAKNAANTMERGILWRNAVVLWAARNGLRREGDFVECGVWRGTTVRIVCDALDFKSVDRRYWLYDVFDWKEGDHHHYLDGLDSSLHAKVVKRFEDLPSVRIVKGYIPESFAQGTPEKIAMLHLDMNNVPAEIAALEALWDRVVPGGVVVFDDYGWDNNRPQKLAEDEFFAARGYTVLEIPTGQGIVLK